MKKQRSSTTRNPSCRGALVASALHSFFTNLSVVPNHLQQDRDDIQFIHTLHCALWLEHLSLKLDAGCKNRWLSQQGNTEQRKHQVAPTVPASAGLVIFCAILLSLPQGKNRTQWLVIIARDLQKHGVTDSSGHLEVEGRGAGSTERVMVRVVVVNKLNYSFV